jgi:translation initiation factor 2 subunit 1
MFWIRPGLTILDLTSDRIWILSSIFLLIFDTVLFYFRVDKDKGYIDLSKRRVSKEDIERCTEKYSKVN